MCAGLQAMWHFHSAREEECFILESNFAALLTFFYKGRQGQLGMLQRQKMQNIASALS